MDCYKCKFRGSVPGSTHSSCSLIRGYSNDPNHPDVIKLELAVAFGGAEILQGERLIVEVNPHGKKNGWASWPLDFDPIWIEKCLGYKEKE